MLYKLNCFSGVFHFFKLTEFQECLFQIMSHDQKYSNFHILIHDIIIHKSFPEFFLSFQLGDGIRCLELEAQNTELILEVANKVLIGYSDWPPSRGLRSLYTARSLFMYCESFKFHWVEGAIGSAAAISKVAISNRHCICLK